MGVPDIYSGEVPVAFVVLGEAAAARIQDDERETKKLKIGILRVSSFPSNSQSHETELLLIARRGQQSELQMDRRRNRDRNIVTYDSAGQSK